MNVPGEDGKNEIGRVGFFALSLLTGILAGLGAAAFRWLIGFFHNLLFLGRLSGTYDAAIHTPESPWGPFVILVPVAGAAGVAFLVTRFAPEAKGRGVPEVMEAVYYRGGAIRPVVALVKSLASALCIGSGGSAGREGPIVQIGSSFGSTLGQLMRMPAWQRITLVGAGAAGGIGATFNTPVGGMLFAMELMAYEISVRTTVPVIVASAAATYVGRLFFGAGPSFAMPALKTSCFHMASPWQLLFYLGLGCILGVASAVFIRSVYDLEDLFEKHIRRSYYLRHMTGMLVFGGAIYLFMAATGHYYLEGVGYATIEPILAGSLTDPSFLLLLFFAKLLATGITLGSGGSGGIFSPSLYMGAVLGGAWGVVASRFFPGFAFQPPAFALAGMAGLVGAATGAPMTAMVMIFEMTLDYNAIIPIMVTVAVSYAVRKAFSRESIYTMKFSRRGEGVPQAMYADFLELEKAGGVMDSSISIAVSTTAIADVAREAAQAPGPALILVVDPEGRTTGIVERDALLAASAREEGRAPVGNIAKGDYTVVPESATLREALDRMSKDGTPVALVASDSTPAGRVRGFLTVERIGTALAKEMSNFS